MTFEFLPLELVLRIHSELLAQHGGADDVREFGLLESALARPFNKYACDEQDVFAIAAAHLFGIARGHPFVDGNKRVAFACADLFLMLNGFDFDASDADIVVFVRAVAAGEIDEAAIARWFKDNSRRITGDAAPGEHR